MSQWTDYVNQPWRFKRVSAAAIRAIVQAHAALKQNIDYATQIGRKLFPPYEAELIGDLIRLDLPYYDAAISEDTVSGINRFTRDLGITKREARYEDVVASRFANLWKS